jgi:hypothetical protein
VPTYPLSERTLPPPSSLKNIAKKLTHKSKLIMANMKQIEGVNYDLKLLGRLAEIWKESPREYTWDWIQWRCQLLSGKLSASDPRQLK